MGNNFCQCKIICQNIREEDLSSKVNTKRILESSDKNKVKNKSNSEIIKLNEEINKIYIINCVKKIEKNYLKYKQNHGNLFENNLNKKKVNNESENVNTDKFMDYYMTHLYNIDKIQRTKTKYEKFDIPKINNGESLEYLLINNSKNT